MEKENGVLTGFSWKSGPERDTTGILMWSDVFTHDDGDNKIAIIILDTQGVFDSQTTVTECSYIFALSNLVSSVQIFNISQNIHETDLQALQLFTEYGRLVLEETNSKPFQKLQFLIRDWSWDYMNPLGAVGGKQVLDKFMRITSDQHECLKSIRQHIISSFSEIECFLLPHPGLKVASNPQFKGQLDFIEENFKDNLKILVPLILSPENLKIKEINGNIIRTKDLITYFKTYAQLLDDDSQPKPSSIVDATAEANHMLAISEAKDLYISEMNLIKNECYKEDAFKEEHLKIKNKALNLVSFLT